MPMKVTPLVMVALANSMSVLKLLKKSPLSRVLLPALLKTASVYKSFSLEHLALETAILSRSAKCSSLTTVMVITRL